MVLLRDALEKVRENFPEKTLEQVYVRWKEHDYQKLSKKFPVLWKYIFKKKYIIPQYRQGDYYNQLVGDYQLLDTFWGYIDEEIKTDDHVMMHCMTSWLAAFQYDRPTLFLEKELAEPFMRMKLPLEYFTSDIKWKWPAFRVYLPKELLTIERNGELCSAMFLDICYIPKHVDIDMPRAVHVELTKNLGPAIFHGPIPFIKNDRWDGLDVTMFMDLDGPEGGVGYAASCQLESNTFRELMADQSDLASPTQSDAEDKAFLKRATKLALNILLYLSSEPLLYDANERPIRQPKVEGQRLISGLYPAKFVGREQCRPRAGIHKATINPTGISLPPHWVSGHHRWQRHGKGNKELKLIWINTYHTGDKEEDDLKRKSEIR